MSTVERLKFGTVQLHHCNYSLRYQMSDSPDRKPESSSQRDTPYFTNKTLSRRASKILVIACIVLILAVSIGGALMLIDMAQTAQDDGQTVPSDTLGQPVPDPGSPSNEM